MLSDPDAALSLLLGFLLVASRVAGTFVFAPFPLSRHVPPQAKVLLTIAITALLAAYWPRPDVSQPLLGFMVLAIVQETIIGLCFGLIVSLVQEAISIGFHLVGFQAGFSIASTFDPTSQADVTVLESLGSLTAGLLFFTTGLHRSLIKAFAQSLMAHPAGSWTLGGAAMESVLRMSGIMLSAGLRLAFPIVASVLLVELAMALLGRFNANLQLLVLSFPVKILASLVLVGLMMAGVPTLFRDISEQGIASLDHVIGN